MRHEGLLGGAYRLLQSASQGAFSDAPSLFVFSCAVCLGSVLSSVTSMTRSATSVPKASADQFGRNLAVLDGIVKQCGNDQMRILPCVASACRREPTEEAPPLAVMCPDALHPYERQQLHERVDHCLEGGRCPRQARRPPEDVDIGLLGRTLAALVDMPRNSKRQRAAADAPALRLLPRPARDQFAGVMILVSTGTSLPVRPA
jgi:hypothetical protein